MRLAPVLGESSHSWCPLRLKGLAYPTLSEQSCISIPSPSQKRFLRARLKRGEIPFHLFLSRYDCCTTTPSLPHSFPFLLHSSFMSDCVILVVWVPAEETCVPSPAPQILNYYIQKSLWEINGH